jgi:hypothetical protein
MSNRYARGEAGRSFLPNELISYRNNRYMGKVRGGKKTVKSVYFASHWEGGYTGGAVNNYLQENGRRV